MSIHSLLLACVVLAGCASGADTWQAGAEPACDQPGPALGSVVVRRERCVVSTEEERQEARRRAREMMEEQNRNRNSGRSNAMGG